MSSVPFLSSPAGSASGGRWGAEQVGRRAEKRGGGHAPRWVRGLGRVFERVALFRIEGTVARLVAGKGIARGATGEGISLLDQTPLRWAVEAASPIVGAGRGPGGLIVPALLGLGAPRAYAVIPLVVARKLIALAYVDNAGKPLPVGTVGELFAYCSDVLTGSATRPPRRTPRIRVQSTARRPGAPTRRKPGFIHARRTPEVSSEVWNDDTTAGAAPPVPAGEIPPDEGSPLAQALFDIDALAARVAAEAPDDEQLDEAAGVAAVVLARVAAEAPDDEQGPRHDGAFDPVPQPAEVANLVVTPQGVVPANALRRRLPRLDRRLLGTAAAVAAAGLFLTALKLAPVRGTEGERSIEIPPSATLDEIAEDLTEHELIRSPVAFKVMARLTGLDRSLRAGTYELARGAWAWSVLGQLHRGQVHTASVTLPEGSTLRDVAAVLEKKGLASSSRFLRAARDRELLEELGIHAPTAEGFLFPETYTFAAGLDEREILREMVGELLLRVRALPGGERLRGERLLETVILASVVEREARAPGELARIAGVFRNRVERNMRLESCATVQYILGDPKARLRNDDLRIESPYNTYLNEGLPPGPIANPGAGALAAALRPEDHDYLFFVAREDGSNRHVFTRTFAAHQATQRQIRRRGR